MKEKRIGPEREAQLRKETPGLLGGKIVFHRHEGLFDSMTGETSFDEGERPTCTESMPGIQEEQVCKCGRHITVFIPLSRAFPGSSRFDPVTEIELGDYYVIEKENRNLRKYDLVILLGSQVKKGNILAPHTELKARAAAIAWREGITKKLIVSGGYNFGVRYDDSEILKTLDFSFGAFVDARMCQSEAEIISGYIARYAVPLGVMFLEELSATTEENAEVLKIILKRTTFTFAKKIAILTLAYHMEKALPVFKNAGLEVEPLFAEDLLALEGETGIAQVCNYYSVPKGGKQWPVDKIRELLTSGRSIGELMGINKN